MHRSESPEYINEPFIFVDLRKKYFRYTLSRTILEKTFVIPGDFPEETQSMNPKIAIMHALSDLCNIPSPEKKQ